MTFWVGNSISLTCSFRDRATAAAIDPDVVSARLKSPSGVVTTYTYGEDSEMRRISTGLYSLVVAPDAAGAWQWLFTCSGSASGAERGSFSMLESGF